MNEFVFDSYEELARYLIRVAEQSAVEIRRLKKGWQVKQLHPSDPMADPTAHALWLQGAAK